MKFAEKGWKVMLNIKPITPKKVELNPCHDRVIVKFKKEIDTPLGLIFSERYVIHEQQSAEDNCTRTGVHPDRRMINPQQVEILQGNAYYKERVETYWPKKLADKELKNFNPIADGRTAFVYYGAYESAKWIDDDRAIIPANMVLFFTDNDTIETAPQIYLGVELSKELPRTQSGIYTTPDIAEKEPVKVQLAHVPVGSTLYVGETVITMDAKQYHLRYGGREYIKLHEREIVGVMRDGGPHPYGGTQLLEYLNNPEDAETLRYNDEIKAHADFCRKHNWHIEGMSFEPHPLGKFTRAKVLRGTLAGSQVFCYRGIGVGVGPGLCITGMDAIIGELV